MCDRPTIIFRRFFEIFLYSSVAVTDSNTIERKYYYKSSISIWSDIHNEYPYPYDIDMFCIGKGASMAAVLLAGGRPGHSFILPHSSVMIHEPLIAGGMGGSASTIEKTAKSILSTRDTLNGIIAKHTGKTLRCLAGAIASRSCICFDDCFYLLESRGAMSFIIMITVSIRITIQLFSKRL